MAFEPITAENLRIGLYIKIEGSWFSHPFPTNTFKLRQPTELETLRGLQRANLFYDPDRSDPEGQVTESDTQEEESDSNQGESGSSEVQSTSEKDPIQAKLDLLANHKDYQSQIESVEKEYKNSLGQGKAILKSLVSGSGQGVALAKELIGTLNAKLVDAKSSSATMYSMGTNEASDGFLVHALNVCTLSILIAEALEFKKKEIEKIALGALLHDIGQLKFTKEMLLKNGHSDSSETNTMLKKHTKYGKEMLAGLPNVPYECLDIIEQHHERIDGSGYPLRLRGEGITQYAKVVMVADEYDELCNHSDVSKSLTPSQALSYLYMKRKGKMWTEAITCLIRQLGVYPPGSVVVLNDGSVGFVTSVTMEARLRPIIMVYSDDIPKEEAMILDLAQHENLCIEKAIQPAELSQEMREYLNPRRIISYYPSTPETGDVQAVSEQQTESTERTDEPQE